MPDGYQLIDGRFSRADQQAFEWAHQLTSVLGSPRFEVFNLYRRTDRNDNRSRVRSDGSILLGAQTADWLEICGDQMYNAHFVGERRPPRAEAEHVRQALDEFITVYLRKLQPLQPEMTPGLQALDSGLRDTVIIPKIIEGSLIDRAFPDITHLEGRRPFLQAATRTIIARLGSHVHMRAGELEDLLVTTPPAQRFEALAAVLVERDPLRRRLPDGSARTLPADHVARLKAALTQELGEVFERCADPNRQTAYNARELSEDFGKRQTGRILRHCAKARDMIDTDQAGYQQVAGLMSAVQADLRTGRASASQGRDSEVMALQLKLNADYWNGALHTPVLPDGALGFAGTDRSLTFDQERVINVLASVDPATPPSPELRAAVDAVATEAARLCNPVAPGAESTGAEQALGDQLRQDFVDRAQSRLLAQLGYPADQSHTTARNSTATSQVVATLTQAAARRQGLEPHEITARLLTTPPSERLQAAAALSLGEPGMVVARDRWDGATKALAGDIESAITKADSADRNGQTKLHAWNRATAGETLSRQLTAAIEKARRPVGAIGIDDELRRSIAAATSPQIRSGVDRTGTADPTAALRQQPGNARFNQGFNGRS